MTTDSRSSRGWCGLRRRALGGFFLDGFGDYRQFGGLHAEGVGKSGDRAPRWIVPTTLDVRDPRRMEVGGVSECFLRQATLLPDRADSSPGGRGSASGSPRRTPGRARLPLLHRLQLNLGPGCPIVLPQGSRVRHELSTLSGSRC